MRPVHLAVALAGTFAPISFYLATRTEHTLPGFLLFCLLIVASSLPPSLLRTALRARGLYPSIPLPTFPVALAVLLLAAYLLPPTTSPSVRLAATLATLAAAPLLLLSLATALAAFHLEVERIEQQCSEPLATARDCLAHPEQYPRAKDARIVFSVFGLPIPDGPRLQRFMRLTKPLASLYLRHPLLAWLP